VTWPLAISVWLLLYEPCQQGDGGRDATKTTIPTRVIVHIPPLQGHGPWRPLSEICQMASIMREDS
jgi:hypothetical protein